MLAPSPAIAAAIAPSVSARSLVMSAATGAGAARIPAAALEAAAGAAGACGGGQGAYSFSPVKPVVNFTSAPMISASFSGVSAPANRQPPA